MARYANSEKGGITINFQLKSGDLKTKIEKSILAIISCSFSIEKLIQSAVKETISKYKKSTVQSSFRVRGRTTLIYHLPPRSKKKTNKKTYKRLSISTGLSIPEMFWVDKKAIGEYYYLNDKLDVLKTNIIKLHSSLIELESFSLTPKSFLSEIKKHIFQEEKQFDNSLPAFVPISTKQVRQIPTIITDYIDYKIKQIKDEDKNADVRNYTKIKSWIIDFEKQYGKDFKIDLLTIDDEILEDYGNWVWQQKKDKDSTEEHKVEHKVGYLSKIRSGIKWIIKKAKNEDRLPVPKNLNLELVVFKKIVEKTDDIYLNLEHLDLIRQVEFYYENKTYEEIISIKDKAVRTELKEEYLLSVCRDLMLVHKACGFRVEDFITYDTLYKENGEYYFEINKTDKTNEYVKIPLFDLDNEVIDIYKKYGNKFPTHLFNSVDYNNAIKVVCMRAGLNEIKIVHAMNPRNKAKNFKVPTPIWKMCSAKTFRKTFASRMVRIKKLPIIMVMDWTGHTSEKAFKNYIRIQNGEYYLMAREIAAGQLEKAKNN